MVHHKSKVDFWTSNLSTDDNVPGEITLVETELSNCPVGTMMDEVESEEIVVGNDEGNGYERILAEDDGKGEEYASEEEGDTNEYEETGADDEGNHDEFAAEEDDGDNYYYYDDDDDVDEDDDDVDVDVDVDFDVDEDDDLMEEDADVEHKETDIYEDEENKERTTAGESEKGDNGEGVGSLEPKIKKLGKKNGRKEVAKMDLVRVTSKSEEKDPLVEEDEEDPKEEIKEKGEGSAQKKVKKLRKGNRRKFTTENSEKVASKQDKRLESSRRKKTFKKVESMGMIFMCSSETKKDCYRYKVLGLPGSKRDIVGKIYKGMRLFLYDFDLKLMYGIYKAAGPGGYNIEPKAFKSQFPSQVRFTVLDDCIPLAEEKFKKVIKENYFTRTKFDCQLKSEQVKRLCKLFVAASKGPMSKRLDRGLKERTHASMKRDRPRARAVDEEGRSFLDEKRQYVNYPRIRRREVIASPLIPPSRFSPLHLPATAPSYAHDRTMEIDDYRRSVLVDHHDSYRPVLEPRDAYRREPYVQPHLESRNAYRREPLLELNDVYRPRPIHRDSYRQDVELEIRHRDEIAGDDRYILYGKRQSYRNPVYIEHLSPERGRYHITPERDRYHPRGLRHRHQSREALLPEYGSSRARYQY